ncbi:MAG: cytochrome c [Acidobacteria bacterium]|nr:cytochrome c [Acidobacteriota bacterium]
MKGFVIGFVVALACVAGSVYFYFSAGAAPVAVSAQAMPFERSLAQKALRARVEKEMPKAPPPVPANDENYMAGAHIYAEHCAVCHGLPGQDSEMGRNEFPRAPQLFKGTGVTDDPAGETYWKVVNGIRLTGMPQFKGHISDTEAWQVSILLANADKIGPSVRQYLASQHVEPEESGEARHEH